MPDYTEQPQNTFVVRFWWDRRVADAGCAPEWHGRIDHVQSGEGRAFRDLRAVLDFIARFVPPLPSPPNGSEQS